jgi:hypothetical protein
MTKLIAAYRKLPSMRNRSKLQAYIERHPMAICVATAEEISFLLANHFLI